jgi:hypothetical protein
MASGYITQCLFGGSPAFQHTQELRAPHSRLLHDLLSSIKCQGKQHPCVSRTHGSHSHVGNRRHKPAGSVAPEAAPLNCAPWSPCRKSDPRAPATQRIGYPMLAALLHYPSGAHPWKVSPRSSNAQRLGSPMPAAAARAPRNPAPNTRRPQYLCCLGGTRHSSLLALLTHWYPQLATHLNDTPKWTPGSSLCYSTGARRLSSPQSMEA